MRKKVVAIMELVDKADCQKLMRVAELAELTRDSLTNFRLQCNQYLTDRSLPYATWHYVRKGQAAARRAAAQCQTLLDQRQITVVLDTIAVGSPAMVKEHVQHLIDQRPQSVRSSKRPSWVPRGRAVLGDGAGAPAAATGHTTKAGLWPQYSIELSIMPAIDGPRTSWRSPRQWQGALDAPVDLKKTERVVPWQLGQSVDEHAKITVRLVMEEPQSDKRELVTGSAWVDLGSRESRPTVKWKLRALAEATFTVDCRVPEPLRPPSFQPDLGKR